MAEADLPAPVAGEPEPVAVREQLTVERHEASFRSGPLPAPEDLAAYGQISPDLVNRIVKASEDERAHRHRMDAQQSRRASMGLAAGFVVAVLFLVVSAWLINNGHDVAGAVLGSFDLVALTAVFVLGRRNGSP